MKNDTIKILAIDDEQRILNIIKKVFPHYNITTEDNPERAVQIMKKEPFDIFIVDYQMPTLNGIEVLEEIQESYKDKPYISIFCTAYGTIHLFKDEFNKDLFSHFMEKPFDLNVLKKVVKQSVDSMQQKE